MNILKRAIQAVLKAFRGEEDIPELEFVEYKGRGRAYFTSTVIDPDTGEPRTETRDLGNVSSAEIAFKADEK